MDIKQDVSFSLQGKIFASIMMQLEVLLTKDNISQVKPVRFQFTLGSRKCNNLN
jgi:hypothetical protein